MTNSVEVKIKKLDPAAIVPEYAHSGDAAFDVFALKDTQIAARDRAIISTGFAMEFPVGYVGLVWDKGGPPAKFGLTTMAGVIDSGYRGEILIVMYNTANTRYTFKRGDKVAQILIQPVVRGKIVQADQLSATSRAAGRFGSTGTRKSTP